MLEGKCIGVIVSKVDYHRGVYRGYIAMLAVDKDHRHKGIGRTVKSDLGNCL